MHVMRSKLATRVYPYQSSVKLRTHKQNKKYGEDAIVKKSVSSHEIIRVPSILHFNCFRLSVESKEIQRWTSFRTLTQSSVFQWTICTVFFWDLSGSYLACGLTLSL